MGILLRDARADGELPFELLDRLRRVPELGLFAQLGGGRRSPGSERVEKSLGRVRELGTAGNQRAGAHEPGEIAIGLGPIMRRDEHDRDGRECGVGAQLETELKAVDVGHEDVTQNDIRTGGGHGSKPLAGAGRRRNGEPKLRKMNPGELELHGVVVDDEQASAFSDKK